MSDAEKTREPSERGLWGMMTALYWFLVVGLAFLLAALPGLAGVLFLVRDPSNLPLYVLCTLPIVVAFSAAMATIRARLTDLDPVVWPRFWRAWRANLADVLKVWVPAVVVLVIVGYNLLFGAVLGTPTGVLILSGVLAVVLLLWGVNAVTIASFFRFRTRDVARLAVYYLFARPLVTLGVVGMLLAAGLVLYYTSEWVLALVVVVFAAGMVAVTRPMVSDIEARFVAPDEKGPPAPVE